MQTTDQADQGNLGGNHAAEPAVAPTHCDELFRKSAFPNAPTTAAALAELQAERRCEQTEEPQCEAAEPAEMEDVEMDSLEMDYGMGEEATDGAASNRCG